MALAFAVAEVVAAAVALALVDVVTPPATVGLNENVGSFGSSIFTFGHKHIGGRNGINRHVTPHGERSVAAVAADK